MKNKRVKYKEIISGERLVKQYNGNMSETTLSIMLL